MTRRLLLVAAAAAFVGWIVWLALAVSKAGTVPIVSRAQLTASTDLVVVELKRATDGALDTHVRVTEVLSGVNLQPGAEIEVLNLRHTKVFDPRDVRKQPEPGSYFIPLTKRSKGFYVSILPKSPAYPEVDPEREEDKHRDIPKPPENELVWPSIYPWSEDVKVQLRTLGVVK